MNRDKRQRSERMRPRRNQDATRRGRVARPSHPTDGERGASPLPARKCRAPEGAAPGTWRPKLDAVLKNVFSYGVSVSDDSATRLESYCQAVCEWSERAGLVSPGDMRGFVEKHVAPSLGPLWAMPAMPTGDWIDVGSGAGLPGLVIKLCRPELRMTLLDSSRKKTIFLENFRQRLHLQGLRILEARVESISAYGGDPPSGGEPAHLGIHPAPESARPYDVILMRAVASLGKSLSLVDAIAAEGTRLVTFKGPAWQSEVEAARAQMEQLGWTLVDARQIPWAKPKLLLLERQSSSGPRIART